MPKASKTYAAWRVEKLSDPKRAARYLNAAKRDSKEAFLHAVKNVIQANQVSRIAREAGVSRESVYRSFSSEGNPTFDTLSAVLEALNINIEFVPVELSSPSGSPGADSSRELQAKPRLSSEVPQSANLTTIGSAVENYDSVMALGAASLIELDMPTSGYVLKYDPSLSAGSLQAIIPLPNASLGKELGLLPGFLHHHQQARQSEGNYE
jgi:probable addiction module antidote protein